MFGGLQLIDTYLADTWVWDGETWSQALPGMSPSARLGASAELDPGIDKTVLFGGRYLTSGYLDDTWTWDGSEWASQSPERSPSARAMTATVFDPNMESILMFGGAGPSGNTDDTWIYSSNPPTAEITAPESGDTFAVGTEVPTAFACEPAPGDPGLAGCLDSNGDSAPGGTIDTGTVGEHSYEVTATSKNTLTGTAEITYRVEKARPAITVSDATDSEVDGKIDATSTVSGGFEPGGTVTYLLYAPGDTNCSAAPVFQSAPVAISGDGSSRAPGFTPDLAGEYRWIAEYSGDQSNHAATSDCGAPGSVSTVTGRNTPPEVCPAAPKVRLTGFGPPRPFGNAKKVPGLRVGFVSRSAVLRIRPSVTYRLAGRKRTVSLNTRMIRVEGRNLVRFRVPARMSRDFRRSGRKINRSPVLFSVRVQGQAPGTSSECLRNLGTRKLRTRVVGVSGRVALRLRVPGPVQSRSGP